MVSKAPHENCVPDLAIGLAAIRIMAAIAWTQCIKHGEGWDAATDRKRQPVSDEDFFHYLEREFLIW